MTDSKPATSPSSGGGANPASGCVAPCPLAKTYNTKPTLDDLLKDPLVDNEPKKAWNDSNPNAPDAKKGDPSSKKEQGGGIYWNKKTGQLKVERVAAGTRDGNAGAPLDLAIGKRLPSSTHIPTRLQRDTARIRARQTKIM
jgi:hypothetical protein